MKLRKVNFDEVKNELKKCNTDVIPEDILWKIRDKYPDDIIADIKFYKEIVNDFGLNNPINSLLQRTMELGNEVFSIKWKDQRTLAVRIKDKHMIF